MLKKLPINTIEINIIEIYKKHYRNLEKNLKERRNFQTSRKLRFCRSWNYVEEKIF